jgi:hypothetical protein
MLKKQNPVPGLLTASGPFIEYSEKLMLYGQFVGSWNVEATWYEKSGETRKSNGEWHFGWILGGRGIQDVLFAKSSPPDTFGTTIRCYDSTMDAWHVTWMQPYGSEFVHLMGRKVGDRIVQQSIGTTLNRLERWSFSDIQPDSFLWLGEVSSDNGETWTLEQEMHAARIKD